MSRNFTIAVTFILLLIGGCRAPLELTETGELIPADITAQEFTDLIPDYSEELYAMSGSGRALISQPGQSDRITLDFDSDRKTTLMTFRNRLGIEGGQILVKEDSVYAYNRIDKVAEQISLQDADLTDVGTLATINLIDLFNYPVKTAEIGEIYQDQNFYVGITEKGTRITINKENGFIMDLQADAGSDAPYSRINYDGYERLNGFYLPRKITIFSADEKARVTFLVRQLRANQTLPDLVIDVPDEYSLY